ncbi:putative fatty acyl-CoA reductase CG5065 [Diorhabda carinulata]|uniref:putative fatty acyl-CoA reductase CG5065 n=1 Tax=Diorhabda carinulata TaxID=1163345 RepID=UPI0025A1BE25|nr:putative fatty acyl-CoA reductase CG5065 [Diorhabda carinulata]
METSEIAEWYKGQHVLVTGATGFMGKILVEKIHRSCPDVAAVYMVIRNKKGKNSTQRLEEFLNSPIFDNVKQQIDAKSILQKLKCISGDITLQNCGMSPEDQTFLEKTITSVFHMAANVKFDQPIKSAILLNTGGTLNVLEWLCKLEKLKVFVHVSTSYCHCDVTQLEEKLYEAPQEPRKMLDLANWMSDDLLAALAPTILRKYPNSYAYTKGLTEHLVAEYNKKIPIVITRPSLVTAAYKEPIPGWIDNLNGPTGILVGAGKGVIRTMHCNLEYNADIVPVDMAINSLLTVAWKVGKEPKKNEVEVYNITANRDDILKWGEALEICRKHVYDYPFSVCLWYPGGSAKSNYFVHCIAAFFFHIIPAYFVDFLMTLTGNKPFMIRIQKRVSQGLKLLQYYTTRPWYFHNDKLTRIYESLNETDQQIFYSNRQKIDYNKYFLNYILATRKYCVKEDPSTLPHARKVLRRLYYLDVAKNILLYGLLLWLFYVFVSKFLVDDRNSLF